MKTKSSQKAFSLIELLIVIAIMGLIMAISLFGLAGARESSRDEKRKSDLETIRSALELYRADCDSYPATLTFGGQLTGTSPSGKCSTQNIYMKQIPQDPIGGGVTYTYGRLSAGAGYELCSTFEKPRGGAPTVTCNGSSTCGSGRSCYNRVTDP